MTEKELKKMSKRELMEILAEHLELEEALRKELKRTKAELKQVRIQIEESGTMAEACLRLSGIFEAADKAAKLYLDTIKAQSEQTEGGNTEIDAQDDDKNLAEGSGCCDAEGGSETT
jgi:hypothetical protein